MGRRDGLNNDVLPGTLEMLILKTLTRGRMHGWGIAQHIQEASADVLQVGEGSLYPALQRLLVSCPSETYSYFRTPCMCGA